MNPNVIENDPKKVKQYMQNFVPVNFYQVLGDSYLSQVRAVLNYSNLEYELSNPVYDKLISDLTSKANSQGKAIAELESKYDKVLSGVNTRIDGISEFETAIGDKVRLYENTIKLQTDSLQSIENNIRASIKNVDVGGRNLIANSDLRFGFTEREDTKVTLADHALGKLISAKSKVGTGNVFGVESGGQYNTINLIEGKEYTISFYAYGSLKTLDEIKLISLSGKTIKIPSITINSDLAERYSYTFTAPSSADDYGYQLLANSIGVNSWFSYSGLKLEIGNVATDWSPNPKDLDDIQDDIYSNIKEFKQVYADENSASAEKLEQLTAKHLENKAEITEHKKVYASQYAAQAQTINEMVVNVGTNAAKIKDIDTVYANKYTAVAERATALEAKTATAQADIKDLNKVTATNTQAIVDSSREMKAELGSVEVGGRNLIRNSDLANGEQLLGGATVVKGGSILGKTSTFTATTPDIAFGFKQITEDAKIPVVKNQRYTLSVYASASKNIKEINYIYLRSEDGFVQKLPNLAVDDMFAMRGSVTFIANFTSSVAAITFACTDALAGSWFKIAGLKLEKGTKATDYSPAPEDIIGFIDKVEATYNEYVKLNVTKDKATAERFTGLEARTAVAEGSITRIDGIVATHTGTIASHNTRITTAYNNAGLAMDKANAVDVIAKRADAAAIQANTDIQLLETSISNEQKAQVKREEEIRTTITQQAGEIAALKGGGRNLLLQTQTGAVEGKYLTKAGVETASALWKITPYIPVRGELDYYTSAKGTMDYGTVQSLVFYDSAKKFIIGYAGIERKLVTSPVNAAYVRISFLKTDYPSIMFQEGNIPTKWAPAPEDLNKEIQDLQDLINGLDFSVDQAILDGVVDQAEAKQLNVLLLQLNTEKAELAARITTFEGNTDLTPATLDQLRKYWTAYGVQHTAVVDVCNSIIESGTVSNATKLQLKTEFSLYSSALANLVTSFEVATDSVGSTRMIAVASEAERKIAAAEAAAKVFATTEANLKRIEAEAYADGVITKEEAARIAEAKQNLADAKADSTTKANSAAKAAKDYADAQDIKKLTDAKAYADNKASLAKQGAEAYALAQIELNTIETNAYADGIVTAEEQARIAQATANLSAAKAEAKKLADAAEVAAKNFATQKADAALALAKTDAQTKADAAKLAAQTFATSEANAKQVLAQAYADGKITAEEKRAIKDANDKLEAAKADATKKADDAAAAAKVYSDLQLENLVIGGTNMIDNSNFATQSLAKWSNNGSVAYISIDNRDCAHLNVTNGIYQSQVCKSNVVHSISFWAKAADPAVVTTIRVGFLNQVKCNETFTLTNAWKQYTFTTAVNVSVGQTFHIYSGGMRSYVSDIKVEEGSKVSTWTPSNNDIKAYADSTSLASENAAKAFATAEANAKRVLAEAYADGKVTAEEGKRIEDVNAKLVLAKADAQAKADLAAQAAKDYADTQISNIEIGGRNLLNNSDFKKPNELNGFSALYSSHKWENDSYVRTVSSVSRASRIEKKLTLDDVGIFTYSINIKSNEAGDWSSPVGVTILNSTSHTTGDEYSVASVTFSNTAKGLKTLRYYVPNAPIGSVQTISWEKLEKGNKATDWSPAPEDVTKSVTDLGDSLKDFKDVNITAFSDGLISQSEAKAMDVSKSHLERGFKEINSRYTAIYNNTGLDAAEKKELKTAYDLWAGTHTSTLGYISTLVTKGTVSLAESAEVTKRFNAYNTNLDALATKLESAQDSIVKSLSAKASSDAVNAISIGGRNLMVMANHAFDKGKYLTKTGTFTSSSSWWTTDFIPVTGGKEYITTAVPNPNYNTTVGTCYYDANKVLISCVVGAAQRRLSTAPDTAKFLRMSYVPADFPRLMLEEGNIPSNYAPSPEDVHASALDVGKAFTEFEKDFNESIKDDIITKAEASSLFSLLKVLENESNALTARKDSLVANSSISADSKTALNTAYTSYDAQYKALTDHMSASNLAQDLTPARKTAMDTLFNSYKVALTGLTKAIESALDSISATRVEAIKLGGRNLLKLSDSKLTNNLYLMNTYTITEAIPANEEVVITVWGTLGSDRTHFMVYNLAGSRLANLTLVSPGKYQAQFKWQVGGSNLGLRFYQAGSSGTSSSIVEKIQLEKGNIGTDWTIAPEDITDLTIESDNKIKLVTDANSSLTESYNKTTETTTASFKAIQTGENNMLDNSGLVEINRAPFLNSVATSNSTYPGHWVIGGSNYIQVDFPKLTTGTTYTFSYEIARNLAATVVTTSIGTYSSTDTTVNQLASTKHVLTFAAKADTTFARISSAAARQVALITNVKLEKGSVATSGLSGTLIDTIAELKETKKTATDLKGNVESTWSMEASVNGEISGIYLTKGNKKSDFKVLAEKFQVVNDKGSAVVPFRVEGNKAYAKDLIVETANISGSLTVGHLPDNLITLDKLVPADRDKINKATEDLANLEIGGRNLIVLSASGIVESKFLNASGTVSASSTWFITDSIPVTPNGNYILSGYTSLGSSASTVFYDVDGNYISGVGGTKRQTVTAPANATSMKISLVKGDKPTVKVEKGNKATDWTPAPEDVDAAITAVSTSVTDITSDGKVTPNEKRDLLRVKDEIVSTHVELLKSVITVPGATTPTAYTTAYTNVTTRLTNAAKSPTVTTDITAVDRKALTDALSVYFTERAKLNDLLVTKTKESISSASGVATGAQNLLNNWKKNKNATLYIDDTKIAVGLIGANEIAADAITAKHIGANQIDAGKINVSNLSSLSSNLGAVTAGSINIGGKFIVDSVGNVTAKSGTFDGDVKIKDGQVDTLQIADNAVTVPVAIHSPLNHSFYTQAAKTLLETNLDIKNTPTILSLHFEKLYMAAGQGASAGLKLLIDGAVFKEYSVSGVADSKYCWTERNWLPQDKMYDTKTYCETVSGTNKYDGIGVMWVHTLIQGNATKLTNIKLVAESTNAVMKVEKISLTAIGCKK